MSAARLRAVAADMRAKAEAATPGPWSKRRGPGEHVMADLGAPVCVADVHVREDMRHIAAWHPAVALAVADWLDDVAATLRDAYYRENYDDLARPALAVCDAWEGKP